mmetsp:Transcript_35845/g.54961  ORF Transcript_35845/g.54961 Transcript_35845/m.54961 type:complete len:92 (+) Transcript_35845:1208-1483(+)
MSFQGLGEEQSKEESKEEDSKLNKVLHRFRTGLLVNFPLKVKDKRYLRIVSSSLSPINCEIICDNASRALNAHTDVIGESESLADVNKHAT